MVISLSAVITALTFFIMPAPTTLFSTELEPTVTLPAGYFVLRSDEIAPDGYISVCYDDLKGLVRASDVTAVDYVPVTKYETTVRFRCDNDGQPVNLRAAPKKAAAVSTVLDAAATGRCYGTIEGDALIPECGGIWYYVDFGGVKGYCYNAHVSVDPTPPNIIEKETPPNEVPTDVQPVEETPQSGISKTAAIVLIVALCLPVPFVMYFMFRKPKEPKEPKTK